MFNTICCKRFSRRHWPNRQVSKNKQIRLTEHWVYYYIHCLLHWLIATVCENYLEMHDYILARYHGDNQIYRGRVEAIEDQNATVRCCLLKIFIQFHTDSVWVCFLFIRYFILITETRNTLALMRSTNGIPCAMLFHSRRSCANWPILRAWQPVQSAKMCWTSSTTTTWTNHA